MYINAIVLHISSVTRFLTKCAMFYLRCKMYINAPVTYLILFLSVFTQHYVFKSYHATMCTLSPLLQTARQ